jgi:transposase
MTWRYAGQGAGVTVGSVGRSVHMLRRTAALEPVTYSAFSVACATIPSSQMRCNRSSAFQDTPLLRSDGLKRTLPTKPVPIILMKACSLDLREKILTACLHKEGSIRHLAKRFTVSPRFVGELIVRFRRTGSYAPHPHRGGNPPRIDTPGRQVIYALAKQHPDATLDELCQFYAEHRQVMPSRSSMHRTLARLKLTRKQRLITRPSVTVKRFKPNVASIKKK